MGRLIDADDFIERIENDTDLCAEIEKDGLKALKKYLDMQPTAYDVDKVVKQLEERTEFLKDCSKYGNQSKEQQRRSYETMMMYEVADLVGDLIDIVKGEAN